jgi:GNAT superfamily N-acetyltransferase
MEILARIAVERICVTLEERGHAVACGMGALIDGHVGINMMRTTPAARRKGHARRVLGTIAEWACNKGASRLYLGVEQANAPAIALYRGAGFEPGYSYRYFRKRP